MSKELYFVHGFYYGKESDYLNKIDKEITFQGKEYDMERIKPDHIILIKDSLDNEYAVQPLDIDLRDVKVENNIIQGAYVYYNENSIELAENDPVAVVYKELNRAITQSLRYENENNKPSADDYDNISDICSYHVNVGHGNCSIIAFKKEEKGILWLVDCSVRETVLSGKDYSCNLDKCLADIYEEYGTNKISKLFVTHLHYDHISGIEYLIGKKNIDSNTEVWLNLYYPWTQATYTRTLGKLRALGVKFIDPVVGNSTKEIRILYPKSSFCPTNPAPKGEINNSSVLYQIVLAGKAMLFPGDIETEGWDNVDTCYPHLKNSNYYCISHHGSINGHWRNICRYSGMSVRGYEVWKCAHESDVHILMGRDKAFSGIFSQRVLDSFGKYGNLCKTEKAANYIKLDWKTGTFQYL